MGVWVELLLVVSAVVALRGAWSPCGLSMLSTVTPMAERSRGTHFRWTATWFILGATLGGFALGIPCAAAAGLVRAAGVPAVARLVLAGVLALYAAACDARVRRCRVPLRPRQVDERWVGHLRPWAYGAGYGAQVGVGLATYVMTAGVYLLIALCALSGSPSVALAACTLFGVTRGLCILLGARITDVASLSAVHRRLESLAPASLTACVTVELAVVVASGAELWGALGAALALLAAAPVAVRAVAGTRRVRNGVTIGTTPVT